MTLDEAIKHCYERAEENRKRAELYVAVKATEKKIQECEECANDHEQLAEWLEELKKRRANDRPKGKWIPVSERLPEKGKQVLCCNKSGSVFTTAITYISGTGRASFGQHSDIIAWQPLLEPYMRDDHNG